MQGADSKKGVLFVCLGNICRSPTAEAVFNDVVNKAGVSDNFVIDSCGTGGGNPGWYKEGGWSYHEGMLSLRALWGPQALSKYSGASAGEDADPRMTQAASARGIRLTSKSRPLNPDDLTDYEYIIGMDAKNLDAMKAAAEHWKGSGKPVPEDYERKLLSMATFCSKHDVKFVPDPYYGGPQGFDKVLDLLDDACTGLLAHIESEEQ